MMCCQMLRGSSFPEHKKSTGKRFVKVIILESKVVHFWNHKAEAFDQYKGLIILRAFRVPEAGSARNTGVHFVKAHFGRRPMIWGDRCFLISGDVSKHKTGGSNCESIGHKSTDCGNSDFSFNPGFLWRAATSTSTNPSPWKDMLFVMKSCFTKHIHEFVFVRIRRTTTTISEERHRHTAENPLEQHQFGTNSHSLELGRHKQSVVETWFGRKSYLLNPVRHQKKVDSQMFPTTFLIFSGCPYTVLRQHARSSDASEEKAKFRWWWGESQSSAAATGVTAGCNENGTHEEVWWMGVTLAVMDSS